jgi:hypothetical protein
MKQPHAEPDIIAKIRFYTTQEGGRQKPITVQIYKGVMQFQGEQFSCGLLLKEVYPIDLGATVTVPMLFLVPNQIKPRLKVGDHFTLREIGTVGEGVVEKILPNSR